MNKTGEWAWVMEEDVQAHDNSIFFLIELANLMTGVDGKKVKSFDKLQMIHFVHGEAQHRFLKSVVNVKTIAHNKSIYLQAVPIDARGQPWMPVVPAHRNRIRPISKPVHLARAS